MLSAKRESVFRENSTIYPEIYPELSTIINQKTNTYAKAAHP